MSLALVRVETGPEIETLLANVTGEWLVPLLVAVLVELLHVCGEMEN